MYMNTNQKTKKQNTTKIYTVWIDFLICPCSWILQYFKYYIKYQAW